MFGTKATDNVDGLSIPVLEPAKYVGVTLNSVTTKRADKQDGSQGKIMILFDFLTVDGKSHQHTEWEILPTDNDAAKKAGNLTKRVSHIMSKFMDKSRLEQNSPDFQSYANWVVSTMNSVNFKDIKVDLLIVGNVYNGKATSRIPGYPPFIARTGEKLQFDLNAESDNKKYYAFVNSQSNPTPDNEGSATLPAPSATPDF